TRRLLGHYLAYGAVAGVAGSLVGAAAGVGLAVWLTSTYTSSLDIPLAVARFHPVTPVAGFTAGTIAGMLAGPAPPCGSRRPRRCAASHRPGSRTATSSNGYPDCGDCPSG